MITSKPAQIAVKTEPVLEDMREIFTSESPNIKILNGSCHCVPGISKLNKEVVIVCLEAFHHRVVLHLTCHLGHLSRPDNGGVSGIRSHSCLCTLREIAAHSWTQVTIASLAWLYRGRGWEISALWCLLSPGTGSLDTRTLASCSPTASHMPHKVSKGLLALIFPSNFYFQVFLLNSWRKTYFYRVNLYQKQKI